MNKRGKKGIKAKYLINLFFLQRYTHEIKRNARGKIDEKVRKSEDKKWVARSIPDQLGYMNRRLQPGLRRQPEKAC